MAKVTLFQLFTIEDSLSHVFYTFGAEKFARRFRIYGAIKFVDVATDIILPLYPCCCVYKRLYAEISIDLFVHIVQVLFVLYLMDLCLLGKEFRNRLPPAISVCLLDDHRLVCLVFQRPYPWHKILYVQ